MPIALPEPYDFHRSTFRFRTFGRDAASVWHDDGLYRVLRSGRVVRVGASGISSDGRTDARDEAEVLHILGAPFELEAFGRAQPEIAARAPGFRPPLVFDPFETLVTSVTAQQVSLHSACAMRSRLVRRLGRRHELDGVEVWRVPGQEDVAGADLEGLGLSRAKMRSIAALAEADLDLTGMDDAEVREHLTALPGIGGWTVDWFLARCLGRPGRVRGRRPGRAQGRRALVLGGRHLARGARSRGGRAVRRARQPGGALPARAGRCGRRQGVKVRAV